ncbi:uncharacterized protein [Amphiura filiformis]|uniref:uncharacterized protein n=1 Tax=Amphiura filiformis TaxID=82378 RepID=UPI003B227E12
MSKFDLVFVITVNEIGTDTDLFGIIQEQLLPNVCKQSLEELIESNASSVAIFFDGYDEATSNFDQCEGIKSVLRSKCLAGASVIVTTRPDLVGKFFQKYGSYLQVEIKGFSWKARENYVKKFLRFWKKDNKDDGSNDEDNENDGAAAADYDDVEGDVDEEVKEAEEVEEKEQYDYDDTVIAFLRRVRWSESLGALSAIPIILSMLCLLWTTMKNLPISVTALYKDVLMHLAKHKYAKTTEDDLDESNIQDWMDNVLFHIGEIAIIGLFEDRLVFKANEFEKQYLEDACTLGVVIKERQRSGAKATYSVTFLHQTFQEMCAASYMAKLVDKDRETLKMYLEQIQHTNVFKMEYLLRFACGWSVQVAEVILPHVVQLMCEHYVMRYRDGQHPGQHYTIYNNGCQRMPILLLYEAEMNAQKGICSNLHVLMKPLYDTVVTGESEYENPSPELDEVFNHYMLLQKTHYTWLDDIRVLVFKNLSGCWFPSYQEDNVNFLCSLSKLSAVCLICDDRPLPDITSFFNHLIKRQFVPNALVELCLHGVRCDAESFGLFSSSLPRLTKLELKDVEILGELARGISYPALKHLHMKGTGSAEIIRSRMVSIDEENLSQIYGCDRQQTCMTLETIHLETAESDNACMLGKAMKYMPHLRRLAIIIRSPLSLSGVNPNEWGEVFDEFAKALQKIQRCNCKTTSACDADSVCNVQLEELDLSENVIGHSIDNFVGAYRYMPHLKSLKLNSAHLEPHHCEVLFGGLIEISGKSELSLEILDLSYNDICDSVSKLAQACVYLNYLKSLDLQYTGLNPSQCAVLFDGLITAGKSRECGLALEVWNMSLNEIGDSVGKLAKAYTYMPDLKSLVLFDTELNPSQCALLFDWFIDAGKMLVHQGDASTNAQTDQQSQSPEGLKIESLILSKNGIGESVDKLCGAIRYMPNLKELSLFNCELKDGKEKIKTVLEQENVHYRKGEFILQPILHGVSS